MKHLMFKFFHINTKVAFILSAILPAFALLEGAVGGVLFSHTLFTLTTAIVLFYVVNGLLKLVDGMSHVFG